MPSLTGEIKNNRGLRDRYKRFVLPASIILLVGVNIAAGIFLYDKFVGQDSKKAQSSSGELPASWLIKYFGTDDINDPSVGGIYGDPDADVLTNLQEFYFGTDPANPDTDGDGQYDSIEIVTNQNPLGEGKLYYTDYSGEVADRFLENKGLDEFKKENIEKAVLGILNPPNSEEVVITLPDDSEIQIITDNSEEIIEEYLIKAFTVVEDLDYSTDDLKSILEQPEGSDSTIAIGQTYETIDELRRVPVPMPFLNFHKLHIAGLLSVAKILEIQKSVNQFADLESESDKIQQQYYQVEVIRKIEERLKQETLKLKESYGELIQKYVQ